MRGKITKRAVDALAAQDGDEVVLWDQELRGFGIRDLHSHIYLTEQQFERRDRRETLLVNRDRSSAVTEAVFGAFVPTGNQVRTYS